MKLLLIQDCQCQEGHTLYCQTTMLPEWICDLCNCTLEDDEAWKCDEGCDFDVCTACMKKCQVGGPFNCTLRN